VAGGAEAPAGAVWIPVSPGELDDRLTILEVKVARMRDPGRRAAAGELLAALSRAWAEAGLPDRATLPEDALLREVNGALWDVEDALRERERRADFGAGFVAEARSVYALNDRRAALKAAVDVRLGARGTEPKEHAGPAARG
jgi:hypothetical protein